VSCSGNGYLYVEDEALGLEPACECLSCYTGANCSVLDDTCVVGVGVVELSALLPWFANREDVAVNIGPTYHMDYMHSNSLLSEEAASQRVMRTLNETIRGLHADVGNAETDGYQLVIGAGAMQLLSSVTHVLAKRKGMKLFSAVPYWDVFEQIGNSPDNLTFTTDATLDPSNIIEVVTSPNNPNGHTTSAQYPPSTVAGTVHDFVYNWPHMTAMTRKHAEDVMVFSLSKLTGYSASRVGWALIKDRDLAEDVSGHIFLNGQGAGVEAQYRAVEVLRSIRRSLKTDDDFFASANETFSKRWQQLKAALDPSRFTLQDTVEGPPFAWVRCHGTANCAKDFQAAKIGVGAGSDYGGSDAEHVRLTLYQDQSTFDLMVQRIRAMRSEALV